MTRPNGHSESDNGNAALIQETEGIEILNSEPMSPLTLGPLPEVATRAKQRAKQQIQQNRLVIIAAGAIVTALLIFVAVSMPRRGTPQKAKSGGLAKAESTAETSNESDEKSLFPIIDSGRPAAKETHQGSLNERDLQRTIIRSGSNTSQTAQPSGAGALGIKNFCDNHPLCLIHRAFCHVEPPLFSFESQPHPAFRNSLPRIGDN